ncbi:MAG: oligosaccharide flippase family protein [Oscillospiraceae bacterium]|nr:oligosaccharide flippase family protein [Oscillospiraceae bacterium]
MHEKAGYLLRNMFYFGLGSMIPKILTMLVVPLYTTCLSPAEYGTADLLFSTSGLFLALFTLNISESVLRFAMNQSFPQEQILAASLRVMLTGSAILGLGLLLFSFLMPSADRSLLILFYLTFLSLGLDSMISAFCRGIDRISVLIQGQILHSVLTLCINLLFLLVFRWGLRAYLLASILSYLSSTLYCMLRCQLLRSLSLRCSHTILREMLAYSAPLVLSTAAWWLGSVMDRWLLNWYHGAAAVGLYAVAFKIPAIFTAFQSVFSQAWRLSAIKDLDPTDQDHFIAKAYETMKSCLILLCSLLLLFHQPLATLLYSKEFYAAWKYTPIILLSLLFSAFSLFLEDLYRGLKNSKVISLTLCFGTIVNLLFNLLLIPQFGIYAAAFSSLLSSMAVWGLRRLILRKYIHLTLQNKSIFACILLILQSGFACLGESAFLPQLLLFLGLVLLYYREFLAMMQKNNRTRHI